MIACNSYEMILFRFTWEWPLFWESKRSFIIWVPIRALIGSCCGMRFHAEYELYHLWPKKGEKYYYRIIHIMRAWKKNWSWDLTAEYYGTRMITFDGRRIKPNETKPQKGVCRKSSTFECFFRSSASRRIAGVDPQHSFCQTIRYNSLLRWALVVVVTQQQNCYKISILTGDRCINIILFITIINWGQSLGCIDRYYLDNDAMLKLLSAVYEHLFTSF